MVDEQEIDNYELDGKSPEFRTELAKQLEELVPEAVADGKVDVMKLKELLDEDAGDINERFGLSWPGKRRAMRAAQDPTTATLKPARDLSKEWDTTENIFIEGDNLEVLKVLQRQYHNSVKMIYIDPPYNTGKDFVYPDNFQEGLQNYLEFSKQVDEGGKKLSTNSDTDGRYHSHWLNMIYPRLKLARNLLTHDGVIFVSIDDNEKDNLNKILCEIYGENNFVGTFIWKKKGTSTNVSGAQVSALTEYVLCFARNYSSSPLNPRVVLPSERTYPFTDNEGKFRTIGIEKKSTGNYNRESMKFMIIGHVPRPGKRWQIGYETAKKLELKNRFIDNNGIVKLKIYDHEDTESYSANPNLLLDVGSTQSGQTETDSLMDGNLFDTPKPVSLMARLLSVGSKRDSIVLDFFSGSASTAHAVMQLNAGDGGKRKHIQVQLPEPIDEKSEAFRSGYRKISDIARERINRAGEKIKADYADKLTERTSPLDIGYRVYKLADTNFMKWQSGATADVSKLQARLDLMRENSNDDASEEDLLTEVMLKMGLPLTTRVASRNIAGLNVYQVVRDTNRDEAEVQPVFYMSEHTKPTLDQLRTIVTELSPSKFVILEDAFHGDDELKTNLVQTCKSYDVELWTV